MDIGAIEEELRRTLDEERLKHSIATKQMAKTLAEVHGINPEKAELVGLLHDFAKNLSYEELKNHIEYYEIPLDKIEKRLSGLWHALVGAELIKDYFGIQDKEIINAVRIHSTGSKEMSPLDKILIISDYVDTTRIHFEATQIRGIAFSDIDSALYMVLTSKMLNLLNQHTTIHPRLIEARNSLLIKISKDGRKISQKEIKK